MIKFMMLNQTHTIYNNRFKTKLVILLIFASVLIAKIIRSF